MGGTQQGRRLAIEGQIHVRVVVSQHQAMAHRPRGGFIEPGLLTRGGGGVVGVAEHHQLQVVPLLRAEGIKIRSPARFGIERQQHRLSGSQVQTTQVGGVAGVEQQGPITRVEHGQGQVGRALLGTDQQQHLRLRIHLHPKAPLGPVGHC